MSVKNIKEAFLKKQANPVQKEFDFLGEKVLVKRLSGYYMAEWREWDSSKDTEISRLAQAKMIQLCFHDPESGNRIYTDNEVTQIVGWGGIDIDDAFNECMRVNGYGERGREAILKNLLMTLGKDGLQELQEIISAQLQDSSKPIPTTSSKSNGS